MMGAQKSSRKQQEVQFFGLKVDVDEWRTSLWLSALQSQGIEDAEMAKKLQEKFRTARLEHFVLEKGVKASNS